METPRALSARTSPFRKNQHGISAPHHVLDAGEIFLKIAGGGEIFGITQHQSIQRVAPNPAFREHHEPRREGKRAKQVEMTTMVEDNHRGLGEVFAVRVELFDSHAGQEAQQCARHGGHAAMEGETTGFGEPETAEKQPESGLRHEHHREEEEQHREGGDPLQRAPRPNHGQRHGGQDGVEQRNAQKIGPRAEVAHPFLRRRIIDRDRHAAQTHISPRRKDQQFEFRLIARGDPPQSVQRAEWVGAKARLRVGKSASGLHAEPEIAQAVGRLATAAHVARVVRPEFSRIETVADDDFVGCFAHGLRQGRHILGQVLSVGIEGDHVREAVFSCPREARAQRRPFAAIRRVAQHVQVTGHVGQQRRGGYAAPIVDHQHGIALRQHPLHHIAEGSGVVEGGNEHANFRLHGRAKVWPSLVHPPPRPPQCGWVRPSYAR